MDLIASFASDSAKEQHGKEQQKKGKDQDSKMTDSKMVDSKTEDSKTGNGATESKEAELDLEPIPAQEVQILRIPKFHGMPNEIVELNAEEDPGFYDPSRLCEELNTLLLANHDLLVEEMRAATNWNAWPETNLYKADEGKDWKVVPFLHTFPATDAANSEWVETNCKQCPKTVALLRKIPGIRTALYSRMSPDTKLTPHTGWADLSNHVIRCHIPLVCEENTSGVWVLGKVQFHSLKPKPQILVFDDSKIHLGFNLDPNRFRCVLIVDLMRPEWMAQGKAKGGMTEHLTAYIDRFREEVNRVKDPSEEVAPVKW